tara:strand:- start:813 stop:1004 length:192 start_codon:yes stop_codon:yes gene_type:complete
MSKGISDKKKEKNRRLYRKIYEEYSKGNTTLASLGEKYKLTKQRIWQIVNRSKIGDGDYFYRD